MQPLVVSSGDPSAIGIELIIDLWQNHQNYGLKPFFVLGDVKIFDQRYKTLRKNNPNLKKDFSPLILSEEQIEAPDFCVFLKNNFHNGLPILPLKNQQIDSPGLSRVENSAGIIEAIERGVSYVVNKKAGALVTAPIAKQSLYNSGFAFAGHTEFLAELAYRHYQKLYHPVMMLANNYLRTVPITIHIPLGKVFSSLSEELIFKTGSIVAHSLQSYFGLATPRLAFAGLNPHAGEGGKLGTEEQSIIAPAVTRLQKAGICALGPFPADSLFQAQQRQNYDVVLCAYHDQALIPVKTLDFANSVNVTIGLPFLRTSPAHGTAFDIVGKGIGSSKSFCAAMLMAQNSTLSV